MKFGDGETGPPEPNGRDDIRRPRTMMPEVIGAAEPGHTSSDRRDGPVVDVQHGFAVDLQVVYDELRELGGNTTNFTSLSILP